MSSLHPVVREVTERLIERSRESRAAYLRKIEAARGDGTHREALSCGNVETPFLCSVPTTILGADPPC